MIKRDKYLNKLIRSIGDGFPKVIIGIKRCGKSYLLKDLFSNYLIEHGVEKEQIFLLELDDDKNAFFKNPIVLGKYRPVCNRFKFKNVVHGYSY